MLIIITHGSYLFGGCIYSLDSLVGVIHILVFPVCSYDKKVRTPWRSCRCIETCRSTYDISIYIYCAFVGLDNKVHTRYHLPTWCNVASRNSMTFLSNGGKFILDYNHSQHAKKYTIQSFHGDQMWDNIPCSHHSENLKLHNNVISPPTKWFRLNCLDTGTAQVDLL